MAEITQTISLLSGDPPNSAIQTQEDFDVSADALASKMAEWPSEYNTLATQTNTLRLEVNSAAATVSAVGTGYQGAWGDQTGAFTAGHSVSHNDRLWIATGAIADVTLSEPSGGNADWIIGNDVFTESVATLTGATPVITRTSGSILLWTLTAASAPTESLSAGQSVTLLIDATASQYAVTWPAGIVWLSNSEAAPALRDGYLPVVLFKIGTSLYGMHNR